MVNPLHFMKLLAYQFFNTFLGKKLLRLLKPLVSVKNLKRTPKEQRFPFIIAVTIDTESGYVQKNESRVWQGKEPEAFIGFHKGMENWRSLLNKYNVKSTFFLSTQCFDAKKEDLNKINLQLRKLDGEGHEIGLHLHPDSDSALQRYVKNNFRYSGAKFYDYNTILSMLSSSKYLIEKNLGEEIKDKVISFRWGNWALSTAAVRALQDSGFKLDSSAVPGIKGHLRNHRHYDWSKVKSNYPWRLSLTDYQNINSDKSNILEIPIATFNFLGFTLRADPVNSSLLLNAFDYYYKNADRSEKPFVFVVITHSCESVYNDGRPTKVVKVMDEFLDYVKKFNDVNFSTLNESSKHF